MKIKRITLDFAKIIGLIMAFIMLDWKTALILTILFCEFKYVIDL